LPQPEPGFLRQFHSTRIEHEAKTLETKANAFKDVRVQGCGAYGVSLEA